MKPFGLQRGIVGSTAKHQANSDYYRQLVIRYEEDIAKLQADVEKAQEQVSRKQAELLGAAFILAAGGQAEVHVGMENPMKVTPRNPGSTLFSDTGGQFEPDFPKLTKHSDGFICIGIIRFINESH